LSWWRLAIATIGSVELAWFVASAVTVGGGLGSGLESDEAIRAAAYSKSEEERSNRLANKQV